MNIIAQWYFGDKIKTKKTQNHKQIFFLRTSKDLSTVANCKETAVHLWSLKATPPQIYLPAGIRTKTGTWDKIQWILLSSHLRSGEKKLFHWYWKRHWNADGSNIQGEAADVQSTCSGANLRLQFGVEQDKGRGKGTISWNSLTQGRYLGIPTWIWVDINPVELVFLGFLPTVGESGLWSSLWSTDIETGTTKFYCQPYRWWDLSTSIFSFSFLCVYLSGIFMLLYCHFTVDNNQWVHNHFSVQTNCSTINPTCVYLQKLIIQCCFTLISPKGFITKNLAF